jgi:Xaa-Pro aminopeptidase
MIEWNELAWAPIIDAGFTRHHGLGHHLGLDVHDPADRELALAPGMLLTVEPGIYLAEEAIGIRIEDNILITDGAPVVTTRAIPKSIAAIEAAMAS